MVSDGAFKVGDGEGAGVAPKGATVAEKHKRGDGQDTVVCAESLLLVNVYLQDANVVTQIFFQLLQNRMHRLTRATPGGIKVD